MEKGISRREKEVVELVIQGKKSKDIAIILGVSVSTIKGHLTSIYKKTGVTSRVELVVKLAAGLQQQKG